MSTIKTLIKELSKEDSIELLNLFESLERPDVISTDWYESEDAKQYIWLLNVSEEKEIPIGFLGYNEYQFSNGEEFLYIVKLYVLGEYKKYKNLNAIKLIDGEKVSNIIFRRLMSKDKSVVTLESAHEKLDKYYEREFGFQYNDDISQKFSNIISTK